MKTSVKIHIYYFFFITVFKIALFTTTKHTVILLPLREGEVGSVTSAIHPSEVPEGLAWFSLLVAFTSACTHWHVNRGLGGHNIILPSASFSFRGRKTFSSHLTLTDICLITHTQTETPVTCTYTTLQISQVLECFRGSVLGSRVRTNTAFWWSNQQLSVYWLALLPLSSLNSVKASFISSYLTTW